MIPKEQLAAWRAVTAAATEGPWTLLTRATDDLAVLDANGMWVAEIGEAPDDAAFIATARTAVPALLDEVERLRNLVGEACDVANAALNNARTFDGEAPKFGRIAEIRKEAGCV